MAPSMRDRVSERFADEEDHIDHRLHAFRGVIGRRIADPNCLAGDRSAITIDHVTSDSRVLCNEVRAEGLRRAEIKKGHAPSAG